MDKGEIRVESRVAEYLSERELVIEGALFQVDSEPCVTARGTFSIFTIEAVSRFDLLDKDSLDWIQSLLQQL